MSKKFRSKKINVVFFIIGFLIFTYPLISNYNFKKNSTEAISTYKKTYNKLSFMDKEKEFKKAREYNKFLMKLKTSISEPMTQNEKDKSDIKYISTLNIGETIGVLRIPGIEVELPVYHGTDEKVLQYGAGHMERTSLPTGEVGNHSVITAHRGLTSKKMFRNLDRMKEGDLFFINVLDEEFVYKVKNIKVINSRDSSDLVIDKDKDLVSLLTCHPYAINSHRLLVQGERVDIRNNGSLDKLSKIDLNREYLIGVVLMGSLLLIIYLGKKIKEKGEGDKKIGENK